MKAYLFLFLAILVEAAGTTALNMSQQFTRLWPTVAMAVAYILSFYLMTHAIKTIPVGITYAIWSAAGIILIMTIGALKFNQLPDTAAIIGAALIIAGVAVFVIPPLCSQKHSPKGKTSSLEKNLHTFG